MYTILLKFYFSIFCLFILAGIVYHIIEGLSLAKKPHPCIAPYILYTAMFVESLLFLFVSYMIWYVWTFK